MEILHIHGSNDIIVPIDSLNIWFKNQAIIRNGYHDLKKQNIIELWKNKVLDFLSKQGI